MSRSLIAAVCFLLAITFGVSPFFSSDFGGFNAEQFPVPQNDPPVQPAGYAFSIWGPIYLWLIAGLGFGLWKRRDDVDWHAMRMPLVISLAVGTIWLQVAIASPIWATVLIWVMLVTAVRALFRAPAGDAWFAALPVGLYAGWLSAASCVSLGLLAAGYGWVNEEVAGLGAIFIALVLASAIQNQLGHSPSYGIAVIWALVAVVVQNLGGNVTVAAMAGGGAGAMLIPTWRAWRNGR